MSKRGPLGKAEEFYVEEKFKNGVSKEEIAQDLDRSVASIEKHIEDNKIIQKPNQTIIEQQFVRHKGATIMTENASTMIDSKKNNLKGFTSNCVTNIK